MSSLKIVPTTRLLVVALSLAAANAARALDYDPPPQQTSPPGNARFEVIQSPLAAKWTFRLDRFSGHVSQLVKTKDDDAAWEDLRVIDLPKIQAPSRPRFQIFTSGLAARHTFLIDTDTGKSWILASEKRERSDGSEYQLVVWQPFFE